MVLKKRDKTNKRWGLKIVPSKRAGKKLLVVALLGVVGFAVCNEPRVQADAINTTDFVTTWKTDNPGPSSESSITVPTNSNYVYDYEVDWDNDGIFDESNLTGDTTHDFGTPGTYTIRVRGTFPAIYLNDAFGYGSDAAKIVSVDQWGDNAWQTMQLAFYGAYNLVSVATDEPDLSNVTDMSNMFNGASSFNSDISTWDTSNVTNMSGMFQGASSFNQALNGWNVGNVTDMSGMFNGASSFNQDLNDWDTSNVTELRGMFGGASSFNGNVATWDTADVTSTSLMFSGASSFDRDVSGWDMSNNSNIGYMFNGASSFNQDLSSWNVSNIFDATSMFNDTALSTQNYDAILAGWSAQSLNSGVPFGGFTTYCEGEDSRQSMIDTYNWSFTDAGRDPDCPAANAPSAGVNGNKPIGDTPTIPKRPTFSGTAEPGAHIVVTVHSDPVTCSTTADGAGNWSCTLASNLPPGVHTVFVRITNLDASVVNLGPYSVRVGGTVTNDTPLAPDTGVGSVGSTAGSIFGSATLLTILAFTVFTSHRLLQKYR